VQTLVDECRHLGIKTSTFQFGSNVSSMVSRIMNKRKPKRPRTRSAMLSDLIGKEKKSRNASEEERKKQWRK